MTREEFLSIEEYCAEHKISHKKRLEELGIPFWNFYKAKQKYRRADEQDPQPGQFVQLASGRYVPQTMPPARTAGKSGKPVKPAELARPQAEVASLQEENIVLQKKSSDLSQKGLEKDKKIVEMDKTIESMRATIDSLQNMMAWFRKKMLGSMSEKNLPLDPSVLEPTLFDMSLSEDEQATLDAEVKKMEEHNAKTIEVKSHEREVRKPVMRKDLPVEETHIYPEESILMNIQRSELRQQTGSRSVLQ